MRSARISFAFAIAFSILVVNVVSMSVCYGNSDLYHRKDELVEMFKELCDAHAEYASYESVGKTYEGRDIWIFKIGNPNGGKILWDGQLHGNEDKGSEVIYLIAEWLLESDDERAERILARNYVLFIPVVNMDSYARGNGNLARCRWGVDLNRNFETGWTDIDCTNSQNYAGLYPASEPETQVLKDVFQTYDPEFYVNTHCGAGPFLSYYNKGNLTLASEVINRIEDESSDMGVTPYRVISMGSTGFAIGDAGSIGISSWLFEIEGAETCWKHTSELYQDLVNIYCPKCLAVFVAMCETCQIEPPSYNISVFDVVNDDEVFKILTKSNSTISKFNFDVQAKSLNFTVNGLNGTTGFCNVTIPNTLLWGNFSVYKNGYPLTKGKEYFQRNNSTHYIISIIYTHSTYIIEIRSTYGIPEFSTWFLTFLILTSLLSVVFTRKHRKQERRMQCFNLQASNASQID